MESFFQTSLILVSILLVATILLQVKGQGSGAFGTAQASFRVRRGVEKTLFQFTIILAVVFTAISILCAVKPSWLF